MLTYTQHYYFLLCDMELGRFLDLNFQWGRLKLQFLFRSVVLVWNRVCTNGNCSPSESQSWLLTWVTDLTFSLWQSWCCSGTLCWLSCCHVATLLTHCKGKICSLLVSAQCFGSDGVGQGGCGKTCPKMFDFQSGWMSVCWPRMVAATGPAAGRSSYALAWGLWEKNKSNSSYLPATFVLCFGTQDTNSVPEYLTLVVKYIAFLEYS